jgi:hypothetical protein
MENDDDECPLCRRLDAGEDFYDYDIDRGAGLGLKEVLAMCDDDFLDMIDSLVDPWPEQMCGTDQWWDQVLGGTITPRMMVELVWFFTSRVNSGGIAQFFDELGGEEHQGSFEELLRVFDSAFGILRAEIAANYVKRALALFQSPQLSDESTRSKMMRSQPMAGELPPLNESQMEPSRSQLIAALRQYVGTHAAEFERMERPPLL